MPDPIEPNPTGTLPEPPRPDADGLSPATVAPDLTPPEHPPSAAGTVEQSPSQQQHAAALSGVASEFPAIPGYVIDGELGRGGMGVVFKATHLRFSRLAAIKMLLGGQYADPSLRSAATR